MGGRAGRAILEKRRRSAARRRRQRWSKRFRPDVVDLLLVAESPPASLDRYFYFPNVWAHDSLFREVTRILLRVEPTRENKSELLAQLQQRGVYLIDLLPDPIQDAGDLGRGAKRRVHRIRSLNPSRIVLIKAPVYDAAYPVFRAAGLPVVDVRVPFPGSGQQARFRAEFKRALRKRPGSLPQRRSRDPDQLDEAQHE